MSNQPPKILVTGANGKLGRLVIAALLKTTPAARIVAIARDAGNIADLAALGIATHQADYNAPETLDRAFAGVDRLLLISASEIGKRIAQHANVIACAKRGGVKLMAYTSVLHADKSPLGLAVDHRATEAALRDSGLPFVLLRDGWYLENYTGSAVQAVAQGAYYGCSGEGRVSAAARADFAQAAATVLTSNEDQAGRIYESAGDNSFTMAEFAAELAKQSGKPVAYHDLAPADYRALLVKVGLPEFVADLLTDSSSCAAKGALFEDGRALSKLIGRPTTTLAAAVAAALKA